MENQETAAKNFYQNKQYAEAAKLYEALIKKNPKNEFFYIACANSYDLAGNKKKSMDLYRKALKINKNSLPALSNLATSYYEINDFKNAEKYCLKSLKIDSSNASSWVNLGNINYRNGNLYEALKDYLTASSVRKDYYIAEKNIANTYYDLKKYKEAVIYARRALHLDSDSVMALSIIGNSFLELEQYDEALKAFSQALKLDSEDAWLFNSVSQVCQKKGEWEDALKAGWMAVEKSSDKDSHHINFGYLLYECSMENQCGNYEKYADKWLSEYHDNPIVLHMGNAVKNGLKLDRANDAYIKNIFDIFAEDFENVLDSLEYKAPEYVSEFMKEIYGDSPRHKMRILDAGCGTGLCGRFLKKYAAFWGLQGVDLSEKMLEIAKKKKVYDRLYNRELISFVREQKNKYDLIVSSDVFTYIGNLEILFRNLFDSLKKNGRLIFTVSENPEDENDYVLHASGRFLHGRNYVKNMLEKNGFRIEKFERKKLRNEGEKSVFGFVVSALKSNEKTPD